MPNGSVRLRLEQIFENSPSPIGQWLLAVWMVINRKNGVSSDEVHRDTGITQKSEWFMLHRIRLVMQGDTVDTFGGARHKETSSPRPSFYLLFPVDRPLILAASLHAIPNGCF